MKFKFNKKRFLFGFLFILGACSTVLGELLYAKTFVNTYVLLLICLLIALISTPFTFRRYQKIFEYRKSYFFHFTMYAFIQSFVSWGLLVGTSLLMLNYYCATPKKTKIAYDIVSRTSLEIGKINYHEFHPVFTVEHNGIFKQLLFSKDYYKDATIFNTIELSVSEGFLGFDIIKEKALIK